MSNTATVYCELLADDSAAAGGSTWPRACGVREMEVIPTHIATVSFFSDGMDSSCRAASLCQR
jgi:hypothetical protein